MELRGTVKWFNAVKGYGFLTPDDGSRDAFLHVTVLRQIGREDIKPGATVKCEATSGPKGLQVLRIIDVDLSTCANAITPPPRVNGHADEPENDDGRGFVAGVVKWFNNERGYGFVCPQDVERDVFVHAAILRRNGLEQLQPGQTVRIRIGEGPKGLQVTDIRL
jgi:CspA family cold shock protein